MSLCFNQDKLTNLLLGSLSIMSGVIIKNSANKYVNSENSRVKASYLGVLLFIIGWVLIAYTLGVENVDLIMNNKKIMVTFLSIVGIVSSVILRMNWRDDASKAEYINKLSALFVVSWLGLGVSLGLDSNGNVIDSNKSILGLASSFLIIGSTIYLLPEQNKKNNVYGPGMALFTIAMSTLSAVGSLN